jgi:hypothetical protein
VSGSLSSFASPQPARPPGWLAPAAGGVPLAYYVATASAYGGLYEEGTFIAAARSLGVPHPPGAPITTLLSAFAALLPIGPLSFRVAVTSAVFASITLALFARALFFSLRGVGISARDPRGAALLALAASWFVAQTPLFFLQATRPNVFAVQFAIAMWVIDALVRFELSEPTDDRRTLYLGAFVQGLAFANHHVFALLMLAVAAPTLGRVFARRGFLGLMGHVAAPILGFSAYAYIPIRGALDPFINIGEANRLTRAFWVLNADPWWGPSELPEPRTLSRLSQGLGGGTTWVALTVVALAILGLMRASQAPSQRRFALLWLIALLVPLASVAWILEPKLLSDAWGALVPCALALSALASFGIALTLQSFARRVPELLSRSAVALCALGLGSLVWHADARGLAHFEAPDALDDLGRRSLPTRAVVLTRDTGSWFRHLGAEAEEQLRADVALVPLSVLHYPLMLESLSESDPELGTLLNQALRSPQLPARPVRALAELRPVLLELDRHVPSSLYPSLAPSGLYERALPLPLSPALALGEREGTLFDGLYARLAAHAQGHEFDARLAHTHLGKAIAATRRGETARALVQLRFGLSDTPHDTRMLQLRAALLSQSPLDDALSSWGEEPR